MAGSRRQWGWHQFRTEWAEQFVAGVALPPHALVLDIGAGHGALTSALVVAGARVVAIEAHPARAAELRRRFGDAVVVVRADARDLRLPRRPFHVVANPPFSATSDVLRRLLSPGSRLETAHVVLQEQAARRWAAPSAPGAGRWQWHHAPALGRPIPRAAFVPAPRVDTRELVLRRR